MSKANSNFASSINGITGLGTSGIFLFYPKEAYRRSRPIKLIRKMRPPTNIAQVAGSGVGLVIKLVN